MLEDALGFPTGTLEIPGSNPGDPITNEPQCKVGLEGFKPLAHFRPVDPDGLHAHNAVELASDHHAINT